jgi:hypothetical protein
MGLYFTVLVSIIGMEWGFFYCTCVHNWYGMGLYFTVLVSVIGMEFVHSFILLAYAECDNSLPFKGAFSVIYYFLP